MAAHEYLSAWAAGLEQTLLRLEVARTRVQLVTLSHEGRYRPCVAVDSPGQRPPRESTKDAMHSRIRECRRLSQGVLRNTGALSSHHGRNDSAECRGTLSKIASLDVHGAPRGRVCKTLAS